MKKERLGELARRFRLTILSGAPAETVMDAFKISLLDVERETVERAIAAIPGGDTCSPREIADAIRALLTED